MHCGLDIPVAQVVLDVRHIAAGDGSLQLVLRDPASVGVAISGP